MFQSLPEEAFRAGGRFTLDGLRRNTTDRMPSLRPIAFSLRALASRLFGGPPEGALVGEEADGAEAGAEPGVERGSVDQDGPVDDQLAGPARLGVGAKRRLGLQQQPLCHPDFRLSLHASRDQCHEVAGT